MKVDTYSPNTGGKLSTFALSPILVENHRVFRFPFMPTIINSHAYLRDKEVNCNTKTYDQPNSRLTHHIIIIWFLRKQFHVFPVRA